MIIKERLNKVKLFDEAAPSPDAGIRELRINKNIRYNSKAPFRIVDTTSRYIYIDRPAKAESFPFPTHNLIILGTVENAQTYLSDNQTNLYTEYNVRVEEVFKNALGTSVETGDVITFDTQAGALRLQSGQVVQQIINNFVMPDSGSRGVYFLDTLHDSNDLSMSHGFELTGTHILQFDDPNRSQAFSGLNAAQFISLVRNGVKNK